MWVEVMAVAPDPADRSRHRVELRNGSLRFPASWPGPAPHVGAVRVVELSCDDVLVLGRNALAGEPVPDGSEAMVRLDAALEQRFEEGTGRFLFGDGGSIVLDLGPENAAAQPAEWRVGGSYQLVLSALEAFDTRV